MLPKYHIIIGAIFSIIIYFLFQVTIIEATLIFLSSFLIDADHYFLYVFKYRDFSLRNARKYFFRHRRVWLKLSISERRKYKRMYLIFHGVEFWIILAVLANFYLVLWFSLIGIAIHMILDYIDNIYYKEPFYPKFSQLYLYLVNKNKRQFWL